MKIRRKPPGYAACLVAGCLLVIMACNKDDFGGNSGRFTDPRDNRDYAWIRIGTQIWMAENLAWLPAVDPPSASSGTLPLYYVSGYEGHDAEEAAATRAWREYGVFYNWTAALAGADASDDETSTIRGACPEGWHIPSDREWDLVVNFLGGEYTAGKLMKSRYGWETYEKIPGRGDNSSGFNGIPAGGRNTAGGFYDYGFNALFWSTTGYNEFSAWYRYLGYFHNGVNRYFSNKSAGFSVRCVKDG